jgi:hypothetical protein
MQMIRTDAKGFFARLAERLYARAVLVTMALYAGVVGVLWATFAASFS